MKKCVKLVISKNYNETPDQQNIKFFTKLHIVSLIMSRDLIVFVARTIRHLKERS
jgi:hypothetical protein